MLFLCVTIYFLVLPVVFLVCYGFVFTCYCVLLSQCVSMVKIFSVGVVCSAVFV